MRLSDLLGEERQTKQTESELVEYGVTAYISRQVNISDILTGIRILAGVAVVTQNEPAARTRAGNTLLDLTIRYVPSPGNLVKQIEEMAKRIKSVDGLKMIKINTREGAPIVSGKQKKPIIF